MFMFNNIEQVKKKILSHTIFASCLSLINCIDTKQWCMIFYKTCIQLNIFTDSSIDNNINNI
jgi:hypothetical protein